MLNRLYKLWVTLRTGFWFVLTLMAVGAIGLAVLALNLDAGLPEDIARQFWLHSGGPQDARNLLSTVFSSMVTMATLVISITMVVLTLALINLFALLFFCSHFSAADHFGHGDPACGQRSPRIDFTHTAGERRKSTAR